MLSGTERRAVRRKRVGQTRGDTDAIQTPCQGRSKNLCRLRHLCNCVSPPRRSGHAWLLGRDQGRRVRRLRQMRRILSGKLH